MDEKAFCVTSAGAFFIVSITEPKLDLFGEANFGLCGTNISEH